MSRPTIGNVIEPGTPADISEIALEDACKAILNAGNVPRRLTIGPDDEKFHGQHLLADLARTHGLVLAKDDDYEYCEWTVDDLVPGADRNTYWSPGI